MVIKILIAILLAAVGLGIDVDRLRVIEFVRAPIGYLALVWLLSWIPGLRSLRNLNLNSRTIFLILFAAVMSAQGVSHIVNTEIPRLKLIFRFVYFVYVIVITSAWGARIPRLPLALGTILLFTSFPYNWSLNWTYVMGTVRSLPLFLGVLYLFVDEKVFVEIKLRDPFTWLPAAGIIAFLFANLANENYILGFEWVLRLLIAFLVFQIVRVRSADLDSRAIIRLLVLIAGVHALFFLTSIGFVTVIQPGLTFLLKKPTHIAGVNTNDISGYLIVVLPLFPAMLLDSRTQGRGRLWPVWFIFGACLLVLLIVKARAAWPVAAASMLLLYLLLKKEKISRRRKAIFLTILALAGAVAGLVLYLAQDTKFIATLLDSNTLRIRLTLWQLAARVLAENPLMGMGAVNPTALSSMPVGDWFPASLREDPYFLKSLLQYVHSHNLLLQLWLDGGVVYMIAMFMLFALAFRRKLSTGPDAVLRTGAGVALIGILMQGFMNYHFMDYAGWLPVWFLMGMLTRPRVGAVLENRDPDSDASNLNEVPPAPGTRRRLLETAVISVLLIISAYMGVVLYYHAAALNALSVNRARGGRKNIVIVPSKNKGQEADAERAEKYIAMALTLLPRDPSLNRLGGEIANFRHLLSGDLGTLKSAAQRYRRCTELNPNSSFCWLRRAEIAKLQSPPKPGEHAEYLERSRRLDPFRLREKGGYHRF